MTTTGAQELDPVVAWSRRVRRVGGFIQLAFAVIAAATGVLLLGTAAAGFHDLAGVRPYYDRWDSGI
jgi:hypothetical protein